MNDLDQYRKHPALWVATCAFFVISFFVGAIMLFSCDENNYCIDGEIACDEDLMVICEEDEHGNTEWVLHTDCKQYEDPFFTEFTYTCCMLDGDVGCYAVEICEAQARFCRESQAIIDYQCKGFE